MSETNRRGFVRAVALGASGVGAVAASRLVADEPKRDVPKKDDPPKEEPKEEADPIEAEIEARMGLVAARFGHLLDEEQFEVVRAEVEGVVRLAEALRAVPVANGEGPYPVFTPYRAPLA